MEAVEMDKKLEIAFAMVRRAKCVLFEESEKELAARKALKRKEAGLMMSGAIIGKNAEAREAQLREACQAEDTALEKARVDKARIQLDLELSELDLDLLKWQIRNNETAYRPDI